MARIRIEDLPVRVALTPEEMEQLWGAGRRPAFRPQLEALEDRCLMSAGGLVTVPLSYHVPNGTSDYGAPAGQGDLSRYIANAPWLPDLTGGNVGWTITDTIPLRPYGPGFDALLDYDMAAFHLPSWATGTETIINPGTDQVGKNGVDSGGAVHQIEPGIWVKGSPADAPKNVVSIGGSSFYSVTIKCEAPVDHFQISAPGTVQAGSPFDLRVTALDFMGNVVDNYNASPGVSSTDGAATFPANITFQNGVAQFSVKNGSGITLNTQGQQTLTISDGSINSTSGPINVIGAQSSQSGTIQMSAARWNDNSSVAFSYATQNLSGDFAVGVYQSQVSTFNPANAREIGEQTFSAGTSQGMVQLNARPSRADGNYVFVVADPHAAIAETSRDGNVARVQNTWSIFVYMTSADLGAFSAQDVQEMETAVAGLPVSVNIVVQSDWLSSAGHPNTVTILPPQTTADPTALRTFVQSATALAPAQHYVLILWGHGMGFYGSNFTANIGDPATLQHLSIPQVAGALQGLQHLDVLAYDACLMGMAEVGYGLRNVTDYFAASEAGVPNTGYDYATLFDALKTNPGQVSGAQLAAGFVASYGTQYAGNPLDTYSETATANYTALAQDLQAFVYTVKQALDAGRIDATTFRAALLKAARGATNYGGLDPASRNVGLQPRPNPPGVDLRTSNEDVDLGSLMTNVRNDPALAVLQGAAAVVLRDLQAMWPAPNKTSDPRNSSGVAIYMDSDYVSPTYITDQAEFNRVTNWSTFLNWLHLGTWQAPSATAGGAAIQSKYALLGGNRGMLGTPTSDAQPTPDGSGCYQDFQFGTIYWSAQTGAHEVQGLIRQDYQQLGGPGSFLGYPTSDEYAWNAGRRSDFQSGYLFWDGTAGHPAAAGAFDSQAYSLAQRLGLSTYASKYDNWGGRQEKWFQSSSTTWYFILPAGGLYQWDRTPNQASGSLVATLDTKYYQDPNLLVNAQPAPTSGTFNSWTASAKLGGPVKQVAVGYNLGGGEEMFAIANDNSVWHRWQASPNSGSWSNWVRLGGSARKLVVANDANGALDVFYIGTDNAVWHIQENGDGSWNNPVSLNGSAKDLAVGKNADGRLEVFYIGANNAVWHRWQVAPSSPYWSAEYSLGGPVKQVAVGRNLGGGEEIFAIANDNTVWHLWQASPNSSSWSNWVRLGGSAQKLVVANDANGALDVFYIGTDNAVWHIQENSDSSWNNPASLGGSAKDLAVGMNADGRLEVFYTDNNNAVEHRWQTAANGAWSGQASLGGSASQITVGQMANGALDVFGLGSDSYVWHRYEV